MRVKHRIHEYFYELDLSQYIKQFGACRNTKSQLEYCSLNMVLKLH